MKIKVSISINHSVSEIIEIGDIRNNQLNKSQSKQVDKLIKNELLEKLYNSVSEKGVKTKISVVH